MDAQEKNGLLLNAADMCVRLLLSPSQISYRQGGRRDSAHTYTLWGVDLVHG